MAETERSQASEFVSLAERMGYMHGLRAGMAIVALSLAGLASHDIAASLSAVGLATAAYLGVSLLAEGFRRRGHGRRLAVVGWMLILDGAYIAWLMYLTGGTQSPLRFLAFVHIIAVTLLASYRTGLKITAWHSLLFFVVFYAQAAGFVATKDSLVSVLVGPSRDFPRISMLNVTALWVVALATAMFSAVNERELRRQNADLQELSQMVSELDVRIDAANIADILLKRLNEAFGFPRGVVLASPRGDLSLLAYRGPGEPPELESGIDPLVVKAWRAREPVLVKRLDSKTDPRLASLLPDACNVLVVPLFAEGTPLGVLAVEQAGRSDTIRRWTVSMVRQFANHAALALQNVSLLEEVQRMAETDPLTGVANRRVFETTLRRELSRASRRGDRVGLLMLDIDHFKQYNDDHGHQSGDQALRSVAQALDNECRDYDTVARYGGEEFVVILPGCTPKQCRAAAERFRKAVAKVGADTPITVSIGVGVFPRHAREPEGLIAAADHALYQSKGAGRDRITMYQGPGLHQAPAAAG